jgi:hypothetical protein
MSAALSNASADFTLGDVSVHLSCSSATELLTALAAFGKAPAANQPTITPPAPVADKPKAEAKPAATPAPTAAPQAQPEGNVSASTGTQASAQPAASGSAGAEGDFHQPIDYKVVQAKVLALSKKSREIALATLGKFTGVNGQPVDHGNKLQLHDYAAFVKAADEALA